MCWSSVWNACDPASEGGMRSDMAYRPAMGFLAHSIVHSAFILVRSCWWSFAMVVVSVAGLSSVASFANSSALSFPSMFMCPGTHDTSIFAPRFSSRNDIATSANHCDMCWLGPGFSSVIASTEDVLSANSMIVDCLLSASGSSRWSLTAASSPLSSANISASYTSANLPIPLFLFLLSIPFQYITHPAPVQFSCSTSFIDLLVYVIIYSFFCDICDSLVQCVSAASPFVVPLQVGFVVSLVVYRFSFASFRQGGIVCNGRIFSIFSGISFVISCTVNSLNLLGMPGFLFVGFMGRGGVGTVRLLFLLRS